MDVREKLVELLDDMQRSGIGYFGSTIENKKIADYLIAHGEKRIIEPQPDGIQFRTVDDLGRICIPKDIRDKLGIKPGTECAVYSTDELTSDEMIVIRRNRNEKTPRR